MAIDNHLDIGNHADVDQSLIYADQVTLNHDDNDR